MKNGRLSENLLPLMAEGYSEKGEIFYVAAEVDGHLVANSEILRGIGYSRHVGVIGLAIKKGM